MDKFEKYQDVPKVATFRDMVDLITRNLHQQILREFQLLWIVADPFAGHFSVGEGASFEDRSRMAAEQERVLLPNHLPHLCLQCFLLAFTGRLVL